MAALLVQGPLYFQDEYLYAAISRSFAGGTNGLVRGQHVPFSATISYVAPLLTAPIWLVHNVGVSYRLDQAIACVAFATAAFASFALARQVGVSASGGVFVALMTVLIPSGAFTSTLLAEPYSYPLFLLSMVVAVQAVSQPSIRGGILVLAASVALCLTGGLQFVVFAPASALALITVAPSRRSAWVRALVCGALLGAMLGAVWVSGRWETLTTLIASARSLDYGGPTLAEWFGANAFLVAIASGWVTLPGAILGFGRLFHAGGRGRSFAVLSLAVTLGFLLEAAAYGAEGGYLYERFAFYATPLLIISFVVWLEKATDARRLPYALIAYASAAAALLLPLTYLLQGKTSHTPVLAGLSIGLSMSQGLARVVWAPALAALAVITALGGPARRRAVAWAALAIGLTTSVASSRALIVRATDHPVPRVAVSHGAAMIVMSSSDQYYMERALFWNPSINRVLVLGGGDAPDGFASTPAHLAPAGGFATVGNESIGGPYVMGPDTTLLGGRLTTGRDGLTSFHGKPSAVVFGFFPHLGLLSSYASISVAGGTRGRVLELELENPGTTTKTMLLDCGHQKRTIFIRSRSVTLRVVAAPHRTRSCALRMIKGTLREVDGYRVSVRARLRLQERRLT